MNKLSPTEYKAQDTSPSVARATARILFLFVFLLTTVVSTFGLNLRIVLVGAVFSLLSLVAYAVRPQAYLLTPESLTVKTSFFSFAFRGIERITLAENPLKLVSGKWGTRGLFSMTGQIKAADSGQTLAFLTNTNPGNVVQVRLKSGKTILISPREPEAFLTSVADAIK